MIKLPELFGKLEIVMPLKINNVLMSLNYFIESVPKENIEPDFLLLADSLQPTGLTPPFVHIANSLCFAPRGANRKVGVLRFLKTCYTICFRFCKFLLIYERGRWGGGGKKMKISKLS